MHVTKSEVFTIANKLAKEKVMPTVAMLRVKLGNRGSETTLHKYLSQWKYQLLRANSDNIDLKAKLQAIRSELLALKAKLD